MATADGASARHPGPEPAGRVWHALAVGGRRVLVGTFGVLALAGALVGPAEATLVWGPLIGLSVAGVVLLAGPRDRARRSALLTGGLAALAVPFCWGLALLGDMGAVVLVLLLVLGALWVVAWTADAPPAGDAAVARRHLGYLRRVLPGLPAETLLREWRMSSERLRDADPEVRAVAVELRAELIDELSRRNPAEVARWLRSGDDPDAWVPGGPPGDRP